MGERDDGPQGADRRRRDRDRNRGDGAEPRERASAASAPSRDRQASPRSRRSEPVEVSGYLDLRDEGYGFLRVNGYLPSRDDVYVSVKQTRQFGLRKGDHVTGAGRPAGRNEKNPALLRIDTVNGVDPEQARSGPGSRTSRRCSRTRSSASRARPTRRT